MEEFQKIGKYEIKARLGEGGMGVVYQAWDPDIQRPAAIKLMSTKLAKNTEIRERFLREARACGILQHPHIVVVYEFGECDNSPYIAMEYLTGVSLAKIIESLASGTHILPLAQRVEIISQVLQALDYAHRNGIVHRDIKPANIMVLDDGNAKLVDFGIAHLTRNTITPAGAVMGTYQYMSPEQLRGDKIDGRSDVYSTAVALYELLALDLPFEMDTPVQFMQNVLAGRARELRQFLPSIPLALNDVMRKALAVDRNARYNTAAEFSSDLQMVKPLLQAQQNASAMAATVVRPDPFRAPAPPLPSAPPPATPPPALSHPQITPPPMAPPPPSNPQFSPPSQPIAPPPPSNPPLTPASNPQFAPPSQPLAPPPPSNPQFTPPPQLQQPQARPFPPQPPPSLRPMAPPLAPNSQRAGKGCNGVLWTAIIGIPVLAIAGVGIWKLQQPQPQPQPTPVPVPVVVETPPVKVRPAPGRKTQNAGNGQTQQNNTGDNTQNQQTDNGGNPSYPSDNSKVKDTINNIYSQREQQNQQQVNNFDQQLKQQQQVSVVNPTAYAGVWQSTMSDGYRNYTCYITNYPNGAYIFATSCPQPFAGEVGKVALYTNNTWRLQATNKNRSDQGAYQASPNHIRMQGALGSTDWYKVR